MWRFPLWGCLILASFETVTKAESPCSQRATEYGQVCVCNSTYCDTVPPIQDLTSGSYQLYTTAQGNLGFHVSVGQFTNKTAAWKAININVSNKKTHQTITGFGGAFTDSTCQNILALDAGGQKNLLESYWGKSGVEYTLGRVGIGATDFSPRGYSYCDDCEATHDLTNWALQPEDIKYNIPVIQKALELRGAENMKLFATAWSAPTWMKTTGQISGKGRLKSEYYGLWAEYYLKFFDAYKEHNINFWGLTTQNEPIDGVVGIDIPNTGFDYLEMNRWIGDFLGPSLRNSVYKDLKIMGHDDSKIVLPLFLAFNLQNDTVNSYLDGIAFHWYTDIGDGASDAVILPLLQSGKAKNKFFISSEASNGALHLIGLDIDVKLGSWDRGEKFADNIISDLEFDFIGWTDWNMVLDITGGPTYINNTIDAAVIVNATAGEFYKQPMYYVLGHFSKFVVPGSVRLETTYGFLEKVAGLKSISFLRPDNKIAVIVYNKHKTEQIVNLNILGNKQSINVPAKSISTVLFNQ